MGDVEKEAKKVVNTAVNVVTAPARAVGEVLDSARKEAERGDVGKTVRAITRPASSLIESQKSLLQGDLQGAASRLAGLVQSLNPLVMGAQASTSVNNFFRTKEGEVLTLGLGGDASEIAGRTDELIGGRAIDKSDLSAAARFGGKSAVAAGLIYAAPTIGGYMAGGAKSALDWIKGNPLTAAGAGAALARGDTKDAINIFQPGLGDRLMPGEPGPGSNPGSRAPASSTSSVGAGGPGNSISIIPGVSDSQAMILVAAAACVGVIYFARRKRK